MSAEAFTNILPGLVFLVDGCRRDAIHLLDDQASEAVTNEDKRTVPILPSSTRGLAQEQMVLSSERSTYFLLWTGPAESAKKVVATVLQRLVDRAGVPSSVVVAHQHPNLEIFLREQITKP